VSEVANYYKLWKMIEQEINIVRQTWKNLITEQGESLATEFYAQLFICCPHLTDVFKDDFATKGKDFIDNMNYIISQLDNPCMIREMQILGIKYASYGIRYEDYECMKKALFHSLKVKLAEQWTPTVMVSWVWFYSTVSHIMKYAAGQSRVAS
jgi:hemoglobin-like flavoprotein